MHIFAVGGVIKLPNTSLGENVEPFVCGHFISLSHLRTYFREDVLFALFLCGGREPLLQLEV